MPKEYFVSVLVPISMTVKAENFEDAVDEFMSAFDFNDLRIGDPDASQGFAVTDNETGEQRIIE